MDTAAAVRAHRLAVSAPDTVLRLADLVGAGVSWDTTVAQVEARRWRRIGLAVITHNGPLSRAERWRVGVLNCGPRAVLASFSAAEQAGLQNWERDEIHVLAPAGVPRPTIGLPIVLHRTTLPIAQVHGRQRVAPALVLAGGGFASARPACGILAAGVQQRLVRASDLAVALAAAPRVRHRRAMRAAIGDIAMGSHALSEIDFVRLCRRHGLPAPEQQRIRRDRDGRRRYLDALWIRADGTRLLVEVDGAGHLDPLRWCSDSLRQNEATIGGSAVLRYPSVLVRSESVLVAEQLGRALGTPAARARS